MITKLLREHWPSLAAAALVGMVLHGLGFMGAVGHEILIIIVAVAIAFLISLAKVWPEVRILLQQHGETDKRLQKPIDLFSHNYLTKLGTLRRRLATPDGDELSSEDLEKLVAACFKANGSGKYIGTDSNVPSCFRRLYPNYLDEHFNPRKEGASSRDVRILFVSQTEIEADYVANRYEFEMFMHRHERYNVLLLQVDQAEAVKAAKDQRLPSTDVGIFGSDFVVFYTPDTEGGDRSTCKVLVAPLDQERKTQLSEYLRRLNACAKEITLVDDMIRVESRSKEHRQLDEDSLRSHLKH